VDLAGASASAGDASTRGSTASRDEHLTSGAPSGPGERAGTEEGSESKNLAGPSAPRGGPGAGPRYDEMDVAWAERDTLVRLLGRSFAALVRNVGLHEAISELGPIARPGGDCLLWSAQLRPFAGSRGVPNEVVLDVRTEVRPAGTGGPDDRGLYYSLALAVNVDTGLVERADGQGDR
jgi:hypothetical protein